MPVNLGFAMPFRDLVGHRRLFGLFGRAIRAGSLPPSLIFSGPEGVGKRQAALALAQALNCLAPVDDAGGGRDACGSCPACRKIERRLHPDVVVVAPEEGASIRIEQVRDVVGQTAYRPFEGRSRVVVFDNADLMGDDAQNALLKTLEEPPGRNVFVLVTARPGVLLDTIRSRCCQMRFAPLSSNEIAEALIGRHGFDEPTARATAALAGGNFVRALTAGAGELAEARAVATAVLAEVSRGADTQLRKALAQTLLEGASKKGKGKRQAKAGAPDRGVLAVRLRAMYSLLRDLAVLSTRAPETALVNLDLRTDLEPLAGAWDRDRIARAFAAVGRALAAVERHNASSKIVVDWLAFQL
jgi:DNA polymerase III subunit delta'